MMKHIIDLKRKIQRYSLEENWKHPFGMLASSCALHTQAQECTLLSSILR